MCFEPELFETTVGHVLGVLRDVVRVESEDSVGNHRLVVFLFHHNGVENHLLDFRSEFLRGDVRVLFQHREDEVDSELEVERLVANNPVHERSEVTQQVSLTERQGDHESGVEPDAFHDDRVRNEVADEVLLALGGGDVEASFGHALDELDFELFLGGDCRVIDVLRVDFFTVHGERLEDVLEAHAVVRLFPHLLGEVKVRLGCVEVRVDAKRQCLVDDQFRGVEERHEERDGLPFFVSHLLEVGDVFAELDFVREPRVRNGLVVQVHRPLVTNGLQQKSVLNSCSENSHDYS